jgi:hypothetical protein|tara:strand:+ start:380 stop:856 length:477 start_codon:yes stop_codon:yes gene_type:complete
MANISTYPIGTPAAKDLLAGTQLYTDDNGKVQNLTRNFSVANVAAFANSYSLGYTVYTALITQAGTAAPVATVLQNTTGGTITWTRTSTGRYVATISGTTYTADKTTVLVTSGGNNDNILRPRITATTAIDWYNIDSSNNAVSDTIAETTTVEIRIYS